MKPRILSLRTNGLWALVLSLSLFLAGNARAQSEPGNSLFIAGTINYVAVPHTASFNSLPITIMVWVNTPVTSPLSAMTLALQNPEVTTRLGRL